MKKFYFAIPFMFLFLVSCQNAGAKDKKIYNLSDLNEYSWVKKLNENDINKIRIQKGSIGVSPTTLSNVYYSNDKDDISYNFNILSQNLEKKDKDLIDGGSYTLITYYSNNNEYELEINNNLINLDSNYVLYFKELPKISNSNLEAYMFNWDYNYKIYDNDANLIGTYKNLSQYEFVIDQSIELKDNYPYRIEMSSSKDNIYIHSKDVLIIENKAYRIIDKSFDFLSF